jgi:hypothetical protein
MNIIFAFVIIIGILLILFEVDSIRRQMRELLKLESTILKGTALTLGFLTQRILTILVHGEPVKGGKMDLKVNDILPVTLLVEDKFGNQNGSLDAAPTWAVVDASFGAFAAAADGLSGVFTPAGKVGTAALQVSGLIGGAPITGTLALNLLPGDATQIVITPGTPAAE